MTDVKTGDRVVVIGEVTSVTPHKNGVIGVTISFGEGVKRQVVVPHDVVYPAELLETASVFEVLPYDRTRRGLRQLEVARRADDAWAIVGDGHCLAHDGEWEYEPFPSSRTEEFFERCRWATAIEALAFVKEHLRRYPTGYKEDGEVSAATNAATTEPPQADC
jgi:hypothetical protein